MAKRFTRKARTNRGTNKTKEEIETIPNESTIDSIADEIIASTSGNRETQGASPEQVDISLEQVPRKRRKRKEVEVKPQKISSDVADMVINLLNIVGGSISDEGEVTATEAFLITTGITNMPASEKMTAALEKVYPLAGLIGIAGWGMRTFTHRRRKPAPPIPVQPVVDDAIKSVPIQPSLLDLYDGGQNGTV